MKELIEVRTIYTTKKTNKRKEARMKEKIEMRIILLKQMNDYVLKEISDESAHIGWLTWAIPDAPTEDDFLDIAEDDEEWVDICQYFGKIVERYK